MNNIEVEVTEMSQNPQPPSFNGFGMDLLLLFTMHAWTALLLLPFPGELSMGFLMIIGLA